MDKSDLILAAIERLYADVVVIKTDVAGLKSDMVEVKTDIGGLKVRMDDLEAGQRAMKQVIGGNHLKVMGRIDQLSEQLERHIRHPV
jgi:capsule polysaccharide export protein KpsE/RkpR